MNSDDKREKRREINKKYYWENKDKEKERHKQNYHSNKDYYKQKQKEWRAKNPERLKELKKKSYERNKENAIQTAKKYYHTNKTKINLYQKKRYAANPELYKERRLKFKYGLSFSDKEQIYQSQGGRCNICKLIFEISDLHVDHSHKTNSIRGLLCPHCNTAIGLFREDIQTLKNAISYLKK